MDKLYKLAGAAGGTFICYGAKFGIRVNNDTLLSTISSALLPCVRTIPNRHVETVYSFLSPPPSDDARVRKFHLLYENSLLVKRGKQAVDLLDAFENAVSFHVSQKATPYVFIHAGVVAWNGFAIVIPGPSRSGKSTLVSAMLRAGATYLSDEFAVLDIYGRVHPYPRPISIRSQQDCKIKLRPQQLGANTTTKPLPVRMVVATHYRYTARWNPRVLSQGEAVLALLANGMSAQQRPQQNIKTISAALNNSILLGGTRGEANETAVKILDRLQKVTFCPEVNLAH